MRVTKFHLLLALISSCLFLSHSVPASARAKQAGSDVLVFINGDQLTGTLVRSSGGTVIFRSTMAGELTVSWSKVQELRSHRKFVVLRKHQKLDHKAVTQMEAGS